MRTVSTLAVVALLAALVHAGEDADPKALFNQGKDAFEQQQYQVAYDKFEKAYFLSHRPALLFNMSSALQKLQRPHEAAEKLRAYLRVVPDDPEHLDLEERMRALDEEQRMLDEKNPKPAPAITLTSAPPPPAARPVVKRPWFWAVLVVGAGAVATGVALGVVYGHPKDPTPSFGRAEGP
jgi:tetratricopeptide (TPR) repeat protein